MGVVAAVLVEEALFIVLLLLLFDETGSEHDMDLKIKPVEAFRLLGLIVDELFELVELGFELELALELV